MLADCPLTVVGPFILETSQKGVDKLKDMYQLYARIESTGDLLRIFKGFVEVLFAHYSLSSVSSPHPSRITSET